VKTRPCRAYLPPRRVSDLERPRLRGVRASQANSESRTRLTFALLWGLMVRLVVVSALLYLCYRAVFVLITVVAAALLSVTLAPIVEALARPAWLGLPRKTRRMLAAVLVFALLGVAAYLAYGLLISPFIADTENLGRSVGAESRHWKSYFEGAQTWINSLPPEVRSVLRKQDVGNLTSTVTRFVTNIVSVTVQSLSHIVELVLIPVLAFYFIVEGSGLKREIAGVVPVRYRKDVFRIARVTGRILKDYTLANLVLCLIAGVVVYLVLRIVGVPYALSLSVLAGVTRFVPVIGPIVAAIPIILFSLLQGPSVAAAVTVFFILLHLVESKALLPQLVGDRLHIHGAVVLIALLLGGEFAGIAGMFFAAPIAALLRVLLRTYFLHTRRHGPAPKKPGAKAVGRALS
jgi:predicted PurR-regulated permease PerM